MDLATIIGIISGVILIAVSILGKGSFGIFFDLSSVLIVVGGTMASTLINFPLKDVLSVFGVVKNAFLHRAPDPRDTIRQLVRFAEIARREGILYLERELENVEDPFLRQGIQLAADGTEPELMRAILETEISYLQERHELGQSILTAMGSYAPAFGMIGTLIGLVIMLANMSDPSLIGPGMAVAIITTFYGAVLANLIFLPLAGKLKTRSKQEVMMKELVLEGVLAIQSGDNPRIVEQKLISFIAPKIRKDIVKERS
ncbi:MAG: motility protein A [candidate division KSB1 bacterium]|nr:motility protein A [candidate division KSB1 bacterium]